MSSSGTVSSLGIGSGVLTQTVMDQLKAADSSATITPITTNITKVQNQQTALSTLITSIASLKSAALDLSDDTNYQQRSVSVSDSAVSITANTGVTTQSGTLSVQQIASNHVLESSGFSSDSASVASSNSTLSLSINGSNYTINVQSGTTLSDLAQQINDATNGNIIATTIDTGDATNPYRLVLKSASTGSANTIKVTEGSGLNTGLASSLSGSSDISSSSFTINNLSINGTSILSNNTTAMSAQDLVSAINAKTSTSGVTASLNSSNQLVLKNSNGEDISVTSTDSSGTDNTSSTLSSLGLSSATTNVTALQNAQDAKFVYDGISMTRSSNTLTDVISGATITLNKTTANTSSSTSSGSSAYYNVNFSITQDTSNLPTLANTFVTAFNSLSSTLSTDTSYDSSTSTAGPLQGFSEISGIYSQISQILTSQNSSGKSLMDYGFSLDKTGNLSLDTSTFNTMMNSDPQALEDLFKGTTTVTAGKYTGTAAASTGSINNIGSGSIVINGVSIGTVMTTAVTGSGAAETNAQLFVTAINAQYDSTGVKASTDGNGKIILTNTSGGAINMTITSAAASASGLSASALNNSTVASGSTTTNDGIFAQVNTLLGTMITGDNSSLELLSTQFTDQIDSLNTNLTTAQTNLTSKYDTMTSQWQLYDTMIAKYTQSFASLKQIISNSSSSSG